MKIKSIILLLSSVLLLSSILPLSGCLGNPMKNVPVIDINITFVEDKGIVDATDYEFKQGEVNYFSRPMKEQAEFPAISARAMIVRGSNSSIGPWEMLPYSGPGTYSLKVGFEEYPVPEDIIHISIYVVDKDGERIGVITDNLVWK